MSLSRLLYSEPIFGIRQFNRFFDDSLRGRVAPGILTSNTGASFPFAPRFDLKEGTDGVMTASFELPGMTKDDVNVELHKDRLTISGESKSSSEHAENENYVVRERTFGRFSQSLPIPEGTDPENVKASVANGILTVSFPKAAPVQPEPRKIDIA